MTSKNEIFTSEANTFVELLSKKFESSRLNLLKKRSEKQEEINNNKFPTFLKETENIRNGKWKISKIPDDLQKRTVEITGPPNRKMMINALNCGSDCYMCDMEDSLSPTWDNLVQGQINLYDLVRKRISYYDKKKEKMYSINDYNNIPTLFVRPRGLHMTQNVNGKNISASLFDFGYYFFHNAKKLIENNTGPYFYLPKLESHLEAKWWNGVFNFSEDYLSIPRGTIKATVLIETILAAFEMDEILYELRHHSAGLNCGRWDYIFSFIKKFKNHKEFILPNRSLITMDVHFMNSYVKLLVKTCHKRGAHAMGGMSAQLPVKNNDELNEFNFDKVYKDKVSEAKNGMDGTWIAHPAFIEIAQKAFFENSLIDGPNQINILRNDVNIIDTDLITVPSGEITLRGVELNVIALVKYIESWISGVGAVAINNLMEDAATAEISRLQLWQWINHNVLIDDKILDINYIMDIVKNNCNNIIVTNLVKKMLFTNNPPEFMTNFILNKINIPTP